MEICFYGRGNRLCEADSYCCRRFLQEKTGQANRTSFIKHANDCHNVSYLLLLLLLLVVVVVAATTTAAAAAVGVVVVVVVVAVVVVVVV
jgi:hypothetical protein